MLLITITAQVWSVINVFYKAVGWLYEEGHFTGQMGGWQHYNVILSAINSFFFREDIFYPNK